MPDSLRPDLEKVYVAPQTELERKIVSIWQEVLHLERIGTHDNFFELGGHSLLATQVISRVREGFDVDIPLKRIFDRPTIAGLSVVIEEILIKEIEDARNKF
jgi:acyl carrier protein